ncbi:MAG TPA: ethylbenzene dehydrogenase-related protein [Rhodocyclaceae bacterium]|nr:ethylbenzene dehydrogenase-related protein [Rhodocyclaceae bacterium]
MPIPVAPLAQAPVIDGNLGEWGKDGWRKVQVKPAVDKADRSRFGLEGEDRNFTGIVVVEIKAGVAAGRFYLAVRWPDGEEDKQYKGWEWSGGRYVESKKREDMFAVRFHMDGDFEPTMLSSKAYRVDVWLWSAARTNPLGLAEDMMHTVSTKEIEDAAEYAVQGIGTVYIKKQRDSGAPLYKVTRPPKEKGADHLPSIELAGNVGGSIADVSAKGVWKNGYWNLELGRALVTNNADDLALKAGQKVLGQIAVFNRSSDEHKSVSEHLLFDFSAIKPIR